jgi:hypothetical protein
MYAWDAAVAVHRDTVKMRTEHYPYSSTIVQPPFDIGLGQACMTHYTWGALYHEGLPSKGAKQVRLYGLTCVCACTAKQLTESTLLASTCNPALV